MTKPGFYPPDLSAEKSSFSKSLKNSGNCSGNANGDSKKPHFSYASLIGLAIMNSSEQRARLSSIYTWIATNFTFYQLDQGGWQNSIRHNLTVNKCFVKDGRKSDPPGKGSFWAIHPEYKKYFENGVFERPPKCEELEIQQIQPSSPAEKHPDTTDKLSPLPKIKRRYSTTNTITKKKTMQSRPRRNSEVLKHDRGSLSDDEVDFMVQDDYNFQMISSPRNTVIAEDNHSEDQEDLDEPEDELPIVDDPITNTFFSVFSNMSSKTKLDQPFSNGEPSCFNSKLNTFDQMDESIDYYALLNEDHPEDELQKSPYSISFDSIPSGSVSAYSLIETSALTSHASSVMSIDQIGKEYDRAHPDAMSHILESHSLDFQPHDVFLVSNLSRSINIRPNKYAPLCQSISAGDFEYLRKSVIFNSMQFPELSDLFMGYDDSIFIQENQF